MRGAVAGIAVIATAIASFLSGGGGRPMAPTHASMAALTAPASPLPSMVPHDPAELSDAFTRAQQTIDAPVSSASQLQSAGRFQQLATVAVLAGRTTYQRAVLAHLTGPASATLRAGLAASRALSRLNQPRRSLPPWKIVPPPPAATLLGYFKSAQARFGVPWQYLAAIELIETDFGRVVGLSIAGAEGPMQFMPATWGEYGRGNVHNPRDAIFGAARYLVANGAPSDMAGAVYHYNPSGDYVTSVAAYAARMKSDPRAFYGYYYRQVIFARTGGAVILPVGFPKARPVPVARLIQR